MRRESGAGADSSVQASVLPTIERILNRATLAKESVGGRRKSDEYFGYVNAKPKFVYPHLASPNETDYKTR